MSNLLVGLDEWRRQSPRQQAIVDYSVHALRANGGLRPRSVNTVQDLWEEVIALATSLRRQGIRQGEIVAVQLPTWHEYFVAHLAAYAIGAVTMLISPVFRTRDVRMQVSLGNASALVVAAGFGNFDHVEMARQLKRDLATLRTVIVVGPRSEGTGLNAWHDLVEEGKDGSLSEERRAIESGAFVRPGGELMLVNFSSGTSGEPKGVMHSTTTVAASVSAILDRLGLTSDDVIFIPVTLGHAAGFLNGLYMPLLCRAKVVYMDLWDSGLALRVVEKERITYGPMVPTHLFDLANDPDFERVDIGSWKSARVSGGPIARSLMASVQARMPSLTLCPGWGFSEALYLTGCSPDDELAMRNTTDGRPLESCRLEIRDPTFSRKMPVGEQGEIVVKATSSMLGYYGRKELTAASYTSDGWLKSGDLGHLDERGCLTVAGRSKDLIIRGGENVPAVEIEHLLAEHGKVAAAVVVGVPDARLGEKVCAVVQCKDPAMGLTFEEMKSFLIERKLTKQFIPEYLVVLDRLPETAVGKPKKQEIRRDVLVRLGLS